MKKNMFRFIAVALVVGIMVLGVVCSQAGDKVTIVGGDHDGQCVSLSSFASGHSNHEALDTLSGFEEPGLPCAE